MQVAEAVVDCKNPAWSEEDEYTLNEIIQHLEELIRIDIAKHCGCDVQYYRRDIDWLKSIKDRVQLQTTEPKFKSGDWIVRDGTNTVHCVKSPIENVSTGKYGYDLTDNGYISPDFVNKYHLWSIRDAKPGDILVNWNNTIFIFDKIENGTVKYFVAYNETWDDVVKEPKPSDHIGLIEFEFKPATAEQHEALLKGIKIRGYSWDSVDLKLKRNSENVWSETDGNMVRFICNAITHQEVADYLKSKHIEVTDAQDWLESLKNRLEE